MANKELECPCCGGTLHYDSHSNDIVCPFCDSHFSVNDLKVYTDDLATNKEEDTAWDESRVQEYTDKEMKGMKIYSCESCGGEIIVDETTSSTRCPYCGNNILVSKQLAGDLKPNLVIPFKNDKDEALANLKAFFKKKPLLPGSFSKENVIKEVKPLYVPFWLFGADVSGRVRFKAEKTRTWSDSEYDYRETRYYSLVRDGQIAFDHLPVDGSKKMQDELMESIEPYNFNEAVEFNAGYLAGIAADRYDVSKDETFERATTRFRQGTIEAFRSDIHGYENVSYAESQIQLSDTDAQYALYPVWLLNSKWKNKTYFFAVNGQTGKTAGNLPVSVGKAFLFWFLFFLAFMALCVGIGAIAQNIVAGLIAGAVVGAVAATGIVGVMVGKNKNVKFQYGASSYVRKDSFQIHSRRDLYLYRRIDKTPHPTAKPRTE